METVSRANRIQTLRDILYVDKVQFNSHVPFMSVKNFDNETMNAIYLNIKKFSPQVQNNIMIMISDLKDLLKYYSTANIHSINFTMGKFSLIRFLFNKEKQIVIDFDYYQYLKCLDKKIKTPKIHIAQILVSFTILLLFIMLFK